MHGRILVGFTILTVNLLWCGCLEHEDTNRFHEQCNRSEGPCGFVPERRACPTNDTPFADGTWREFRPFRVFLPIGVEVESCCLSLELGRMNMVVPGTSLHATMVVSGNSGDDIDSMIEYSQSFSSDEQSVQRANVPGINSQSIVWYMEKKYPDRRILMELRGSSASGMRLRGYCELKTGVSLFAVRSEDDVAYPTCELLWRLLRSIKVEIKCRDAFNCLRTEAPGASHIPATRKLQWKEVNLDIGDFEWKSFRQFRVFLPSNVNVECCCIDEEDFVFDMPDKSHYVTAYGIDLEDDEIDKKLELYSYSSADLDGSIPLEEKEKIHIALVLREVAGIDWYMERKCRDRRLLIEHRHQSETCEGVLCCCEFDEGPCVYFKIRGSGAIDRENLEYFMKVCEEFRYEEIVVQ